MPAAVVHVFRVGDRVKLKMGARKVEATVVEDRGLIGPLGSQLVRVSIPDATYETQFEVSASLVEPVQSHAKH